MLNVGFYKNHKPFDYDPAKKITTENIYDSNNNTEINFDNNIIYDNDYLIYRTPWELVDGNKLSELDKEPIIYSKKEINMLKEIIENDRKNLEYINNNNYDKPKLRIK